MTIYNVWKGEYEDTVFVKSFRDEQSAKDYCTMISLLDESARVSEQEVSDEYIAPDYFWVKAAAWNSKWEGEGIQTDLQSILTQKDLETEFAEMWDVNVHKKLYETQVPPLEIFEDVRIVKHLEYDEYYIYMKVEKNSFFGKDEFEIDNVRGELKKRADEVANCLKFNSEKS